MFHNWQQIVGTKLPVVRALLGHKMAGLAGNSAIFFSGRLTGAVCAYVMQVVLARCLGGPELGAYVCAFSWCIILANSSLLGLSNAAMRFVGMGLASGDHGRIRGFVHRSRQIAMISSCLVAAIGAGVVLLLGDRVPNRWLFLIAVSCVPVFAFIRLNVGITQAFSWFALAILPNGVLRPLLLLAAIVVAWKLQLISSAADVMLLHLVVMLLIAAGQQLVLSRRITGRLAKSPPSYESRRWLRTALPILLTSTFTLFYPELNVIIVGALLPAKEIAIFSAGYRTTLLIVFALTAVDAVTMPAASRLYTERNTAELGREIARATRLKFCLSLVAMLGVTAVGKYVLSIFGSEFVAGYRPLVILAAAQLARAAIGPAGELLSVTGHQDRCLPVVAVGLLATAALHLVLVPQCGIEGAALTVLLVTLGAQLWLRRRAIEHIGIDTSVLALKRHG